jgi:hypothetical protein
MSKRIETMRIISKSTILVMLLLAGCATNLASEGEKVRVVSDNQKQNDCQFIKLISVSVGLGPDKPGSALKKALNEAGGVGANGFYVITNVVHWADGASVTGEALTCKNI